MSEPVEGAKRKTPIWVWIVGGVLVLAGLGSIVGGDDEGSPETQLAETTETVEPEPVEAEPESEGPSDAEKVLLSEAFCNDLSEGFSLFQLYEGGLEGGSYETPEEFANLAYGFAWLSCPEQLEENEGLRTYLESWGIDPDTGGVFRASPEEELGFTEEELVACFTQWELDQEAVLSGSDDETALRATAYDCPTYEAWSLGFNLYSSGNESTMIQALCAFEAESPVCRDAEAMGLLG